MDVTNIAGVPGSSTLFLHEYYKEHGGGSFEDVFSRFDLDSDETVPFPKVGGNCCHLQGGMDPELWAEQGKSREAFEHQQEDEAEVIRHGIKVLKTCTPYLAGNMPAYGEHCAWMESSAVVFCNSVVGARTNTEGRESTSAAMLTGKIPDWGFHRDEYRRGTHLIQVDVPVESVMDWGMLGYFIGDAVQENIPVVVGKLGQPDLIRHKHFGAAAASSGGVEMYHIVGVTPEAPSLEAALGSKKPLATIHYGPAERRRVYESLNSNGRDLNVDYVMLGCPHASDRTDRRGRAAACGQENPERVELVALHVARGEERRRSPRLHQNHSRCGRPGDDRHVLRHRPNAAGGNQGGRARFRQAGSLPAGDHGH